MKKNASFGSLRARPDSSQKQGFLAGAIGGLANHDPIQAAELFATLPAGAKEIFVLHDIEGYKHEEIAELLGITTGTSKSQLHRARMMLREHLA